jgi:hypothetical protein
MNQSEVDEGLELPKTEERLPGLPPEPGQELNAETLAEASPVPAPLSPSSLNPSWLRLAYALEFLIALIAIISVWSEIGGEGHLDLMPWYTKLGCIVGLAWCCVRFTAGIVEQQQVWTRRTLAWFVGIVLFCIAMGGITYYYHLHEESDDGDDDTAAAVRNITSLGTFFDHVSKRTQPSIPICFLARSPVFTRDRIPVGGHGRDPLLQL